MAKIPKVKKREVSVHSRAARRAASPPPQTGAGKVVETEYKPWLHSAQNAGIGKKKTKQLTRQQKLRQQRGIEKADVLVDKLEKKVEDSKSRARRVQARAVDWEELNEKITDKPKKDVGAVNNATAASEEVELDDTMKDVAAEDNASGPLNVIGEPSSLAEVPQPEPTATAPEEIDEIT